MDIGGTTIKGGIFTSTSQQILHRTRPTFESGHTPLENLLHLLHLLRREANNLGLEPQTVGIGTPGFVDSSRGIIRYAANLGWHDINLRALLQEAVALPVVIDHDARAAARAELNIRPHLQDLIVIPIGTGVAAAIITQGRIVSGYEGAAGEFGHTISVPDGEPCPCGQKGCLETYASASAILRRYRAAGGTQAHHTSEIPTLLNTDRVAAHVWADAIAALATGISNLTAVLDPQEVVISGGLARAGNNLLHPLRTAITQRLQWRRTPTISLSNMASRAGLQGAALMALDQATPPHNQSTRAPNRTQLTNERRRPTITR
ncbi:ROK family protein [Arthrobacter tumbae]